MPGRRTVAAVATGKHHTVAVTRAGELFTWGSNRDGRLGYTAVDTQPTPRRYAIRNLNPVGCFSLPQRINVKSNLTVVQ